MHIKCMSVKNQMSYYNVKNFKKWNFLKFWAIDRKCPTLNKFYCSYFHKWKKIKFKCLYKIWFFFFSFDMKKKGNLKHVIGKMKKNMNMSP
jgi:hypothetical protein